MQRHEVRLRGAESWGGGGWGRTARYESSGGVVPSRCPGSGRSETDDRARSGHDRVAPTISAANGPPSGSWSCILRGRNRTTTTCEPFEQTLQASHPFAKISDVEAYVTQLQAYRAHARPHQSGQCDANCNHRNQFSAHRTSLPITTRRKPPRGIAGSTHQNPNRSIGRPRTLCAIAHCRCKRFRFLSAPIGGTIRALLAPTPCQVA